MLFTFCLKLCEHFACYVLNIYVSYSTFPTQTNCCHQHRKQRQTRTQNYQPFFVNNMAENINKEKQMQDDLVSCTSKDSDMSLDSLPEDAWNTLLHENDIVTNIKYFPNGNIKVMTYGKATGKYNKEYGSQEDKLVVLYGLPTFNKNIYYESIKIVSATSHVIEDPCYENAKKGQATMDDWDACFESLSIPFLYLRNPLNKKEPGELDLVNIDYGLEIEQNENVYEINIHNSLNKEMSEVTKFLGLGTKHFFSFQFQTKEYFRGVSFVKYIERNVVYKLQILPNYPGPEDLCLYQKLTHAESPELLDLWKFLELALRGTFYQQGGIEPPDNETGVKMLQKLIDMFQKEHPNGLKINEFSGVPANPNQHVENLLCSAAFMALGIYLEFTENDIPIEPNNNDNVPNQPHDG